jgi:hypothetical protein
MSDSEELLKSIILWLKLADDCGLSVDQGKLGR